MPVARASETVDFLSEYRETRVAVVKNAFVYARLSIKDKLSPVQISF